MYIHTVPYPRTGQDRFWLNGAPTVKSGYHSRSRHHPRRRKWYTYSYMPLRAPTGPVHTYIPCPSGVISRSSRSTPIPREFDVNASFHRNRYVDAKQAYTRTEAQQGLALFFFFFWSGSPGGRVRDVPRGFARSFARGGRAVLTRSMSVIIVVSDPYVFYPIPLGSLRAVFLFLWRPGRPGSGCNFPGVDG